MAGTGDEDEDSLYTLNEGEESEDESSYISGESGETLTIVHAGEETDHLEAIQEQSTPTVDDGAINDASVAKEVETEDEEIEEEATEDDETSEDDLYNREYITPIEDPYQKALKYFAKHNILELFGDITALIVMRRPDNPYNLMVDELVKLQELEMLKGHVISSDRRYVPPKRVVSLTAAPEGTGVAEGVTPEGAGVAEGDTPEGTGVGGDSAVEETPDNKEQFASGFAFRDTASTGFGVEFPLGQEQRSKQFPSSPDDQEADSSLSDHDSRKKKRSSVISAESDASSVITVPEVPQEEVSEYETDLTVTKSSMGIDG